MSNAEARREAALKRGIDELQNRLEWVLRERPHALANARREYVAYCLRLYRKIERAIKQEGRYE
jgi:hypothetical protein